MDETERLTNKVARLKESKAEAQSEFRMLSHKVDAALGKLSSRSALLEAAMRVIMKHNLLDDFSTEFNHPGSSIERQAATLQDLAAATAEHGPDLTNGARGAGS